MEGDEEENGSMDFENILALILDSEQTTPDAFFTNPINNK